MGKKFVFKRWRFSET